LVNRRKETPVPIAIPKFSQLPFIPAGDFGEISRNPGDAFNLGGTAIRALIFKTAGGPPAFRASGEFRGEGNLIILGIAENLDYKIGQRFLGGAGLPQPEVGQSARFDQRMEKPFLAYAFDRI
jgi:hypothetical protein